MTPFLTHQHDNDSRRNHSVRLQAFVKNWGGQFCLLNWVLVALFPILMGSCEKGDNDYSEDLTTRTDSVGTARTDTVGGIHCYADTSWPHKGNIGYRLYQPGSPHSFYKKKIFNN